MGDMSVLFSKMIGTLAVILVVAAFIGTSDVTSKLVKTERKWIHILLVGVLG